MALMSTKSDEKVSDQGPSEEIVHWTWEDDPDESLCGQDMTGERWEHESVPVNCEACIFAENFLVELEEKLGGE